MGLADKVIKRLEQQADTIAQYRQLDEKRRARICELERKLGDAERERDKLGAEVETRRKELDTLTHLSQEQCETLRKQRDAAEAAADNLRVSADNLRKDRDHWKESRQQAIEAGELMKAEIETLRAFVAKAREPRQRRRDEMDFQSIPSAYCNRALDDLGTPEPAQVTEPLDAEGGA